MFNKRFLCYQPVVASKASKGIDTTINIDLIIRNVGAKNKEEAIGKFILKTKCIEALEKLDPVCFLLDDLLKID